MASKEPDKPATQEDKIINVLYAIGQMLSNGHGIDIPGKREPGFQVFISHASAINLHEEVRMIAGWLESGKKDDADYKQLYSDLVDKCSQIQATNLKLRELRLNDLQRMDEYNGRMDKLMEKVKELEDSDSEKILADVKRLATYLWKTHYKEEAPHWKAYDDTCSILSQIDNMISGLIRKPTDEKN